MHEKIMWRTTMKKIYYIIALFIALASCASIAQGYPMPALSKKSIEEKFKSAEQGFAKRWKAFAKNRKFTAYPRQFTDEQILAEFDTVIATRCKLKEQLLF